MFLVPVLSTCCSGLPRLRRAAVGNIVRDHSPQRVASQVAAQPVLARQHRCGSPHGTAALAHRQRCRTQSRCRSGRRESGDGDGAARDAAPATLTLHGDALAQPSCRFVSGRRHHVGDRASWRASSADRRRWTSPSLTHIRTESSGSGRQLSVRHAFFPCLRMRVVSPVSQELRRPPSATEGATHRSERAAGAAGTRRRSNAFNTPPGPEAKTSEESRKDNSCIQREGQTTSRSPGGTQARSVQTAVGIAASGIQTMRRTSGFHCCQISSALASATRVVCVP
ncbi:hypothetical protein TcBrA4_0096060 [Trypanosoma cruzi]|nr:hypothetical protein TcBrA4_0096060 [Trypanosoma cruzi]